MEFDPNSVENFNYLSAILQENCSKKTEIPFMVPMEQRSTISTHPSHDTTFSFQSNYYNFQQHPQNGANNYSSFSVEGPSSISPFCMIPTPCLGNSFKATHSNGSITDYHNASYPMAISPNNNKMEVMQGNLISGNNYLDFINKNPVQYNEISQSQVGPSFSPLIVNDVATFVQGEPKYPEELSHTVEIGNNHLEIDLRLNVGDQEERRGFEMNNNGSHHTDTNRIKGQWTGDEDRALTELVNRYGVKKWSQIAKFIDGRNGKQCRERWNNHLRPDIRKDSWSEEEEKILVEAHMQVGNKWAEIARRLPERSENTIKNHWNTIKRSVNCKRKQNMSKYGSEGTLLQKYIKEVTNVEGIKNEMKQSMRMLTIGSNQDQNN